VTAGGGSDRTDLQAANEHSITVAELPAAPGNRAHDECGHAEMVQARCASRQHCTQHEGDATESFDEATKFKKHSLLSRTILPFLL